MTPDSVVDADVLNTRNPAAATRTLVNNPDTAGMTPNVTLARNKADVLYGKGTTQVSYNIFSARTPG